MTSQGLRELIEGDPLTDRELEVLRGAANGEVSKQTASRMFLADETVRAYRKAAMAKLSARNTTHAVAIAIRTGLI